MEAEFTTSSSSTRYLVGTPVVQIDFSARTHVRIYHSLFFCLLTYTEVYEYEYCCLYKRSARSYSYTPSSGHGQRHIHAGPSPFSVCLYVESVLRRARYIHSRIHASSLANSLYDCFETRKNSSERQQQQSRSRMTALPDTWQTPDLQIEPTILSPRRRTRLRKWAGAYGRVSLCLVGRERARVREVLTVGRNSIGQQSHNSEKNHGITPNIRRFIADNRFPPEPHLFFLSR